jgi:hypothetical protein
MVRRTFVFFAADAGAGSTPCLLRPAAASRALRVAIARRASRRRPLLRSSGCALKTSAIKSSSADVIEVGADAESVEGGAGADAADAAAPGAASADETRAAAGSRGCTGCGSGTLRRSKVGCHAGADAAGYSETLVDDTIEAEDAVSGADAD